MDPKIAKKTQDSLGKVIKKPPLTEKLLSKPPFRFLHDVMTSVIKTTGVMKGLFSDSELNSENVKDKDSKIAFLQKAIDFVSHASGKSLPVKPAKVVAGHEPERTNEFLQALAAAISNKVDNDSIVDAVKKGGKPSSKKEEKEEKPQREKSSDRRRRDEDKKSRDREERSRDREKEDRHKEKEDKHHKEKEERPHKDREDKHKDRDEKHRDRDRERESRHKSGRGSRPSDDEMLDEPAVIATKQKTVARSKLDKGIEDAINATFAVENPKQVFCPDDRPMRPIARKYSTYKEIRNTKYDEDDIDKDLEGEIDGDFDDQDDEFDNFFDDEQSAKNSPKMTQSGRPLGARKRSKKRIVPSIAQLESQLSDEPKTPFVSQGNSPEAINIIVKRRTDHDSKKKNEPGLNKSDAKVFHEDRKLKKEKSGNLMGKDSGSKQKQKTKTGKGPLTSTPKGSPVSPRRAGVKTAVDGAKRSMDKVERETDVTPKGKMLKRRAEKDMRPKLSGRHGKVLDQSRKKMTDTTYNKHKESKNRLREQVQKNDDSSGVCSPDGDNSVVVAKERERHKKKLRSRNNVEMNVDDESASDQERMIKKHKEKTKYRNDDYEHDKIKQTKDVEDDNKEKQQELEVEEVDGMDKKEGKDQYYEKKMAYGIGDKRRRSSFETIYEQQKREDEGKENDAPKETMVNGDHKQSDAPTKMQRPTSAKGSRRRMEDGGLSSDEDVPAQKQDAGFGGEDDTVPSQPVGRLARPSSARPAPPKRKDDIVQQEPAMRLGSGKPQNLILDDGKDSDEDETFVVEEAAPPPMEAEQPPPMAGDEDDDEDHGGLVKKIMETKKEYEQPRENKIERPTISDAQRRKQREAVQKEIDKLRGSIQTLTRSANPLGKIMDYVQEDLDSMQKELEKWKQENKEHGLALKREKAITERAVEPLKVQLGEVDQAIKDQLDLIGAVKSNIIRNDQKTEKMLRTIAKS